MLDPNDPRYSPPALISQRLKNTKVDSAIPEASDVQGTLKYWDDYRKKERDRIAALAVPLVEDPDLGSMASGEGLRSLGMKIGEMPSVRTLWEREVTNALEECYQKGGSPEIVLLSPKQALMYGVIGPWRYRWLKLRGLFSSRLRGIWKRNESFGAPSAPPTRGTRRPEA